jgi:hypothetical protein
MWKGLRSHKSYHPPTTKHLQQHQIDKARPSSHHRTLHQSQSFQVNEKLAEWQKHEAIIFVQGRLKEWSFMAGKRFKEF